MSTVQLDPRESIIVQLYNTLLKSIEADIKKFQESVEKTYNKVLSTLAAYTDFDKLDPVTRKLLESNLMSDIILSHLEYLDETEAGDNSGINENWLKLSGRTKALIYIALAKAARKDVLPVEGRRAMVYGRGERF